MRLFFTGPQVAKCPKCHLPMIRCPKEYICFCEAEADSQNSNACSGQFKPETIIRVPMDEAKLEAADDTNPYKYQEGGK